MCQVKEKYNKYSFENALVEKSKDKQELKLMT